MQTGVDATDPGAILASLSGAGGFTPVALGILQALDGGRAANVADAFAAVLVNSATNDTVRLTAVLLCT